ncbi:MAG TPA: PIN domain-containing protein [Anaerolineales bacterium]|nr:PIN domain-containing protein [Anaerolineales bacterium]HNS61652.1 PIN domain-containing protein [Anaerolineales bacterium]
MILLDTDVMVDVLRGFEPAKEWLKSAQEIAVPGLVAMELIQGCQNTKEQRQLEKALSDYQLFWPNEDDCNRALTSFSDHHLSDKIGLLDALIAETAIGVEAELATFNVKHYRVLRGLKTIQPYSK